MSQIFRPAWWMAMLVLATCALTAGLGVWQTHRGAQKQALLDALATAATQAPQPLGRGSVAGDAPVRAEARGRYDAAHQLLLDNQTHESRPGYHVWTPLRLADGGVILVNRGWLLANPDRRVLPELSAPAGEVVVRGLWRALPEPGLKLTAADAEPTGFPKVVSYPDGAELRKALGADLVSGVLLLDPDLPDGFARDWQANFVGFPPSRHYAYAAQWFALCATLLFLFIKFNLKKSDD